jgi:hypothetical protein
VGGSKKQEAPIVLSFFRVALVAVGVYGLRSDTERSVTCVILTVLAVLVVMMRKIFAYFGNYS